VEEFNPVITSCEYFTTDHITILSFMYSKYYEMCATVDTIGKSHTSSYIISVRYTGQINLCCQLGTEIYGADCTLQCVHISL